MGKTRIVRSSTGIGKTKAVIDELLALVLLGVDEPLVVAVPEHRKADELVEDINAAAGMQIARSWRGIDQEDPEQIGQSMCRVAPKAKIVIEAGGQISGLCAPRTPKGATKLRLCPHRKDCGYKRQLKMRSEIWVITHAMLSSKAPAAIVETK
jgi:hypothetical protein